MKILSTFVRYMLCHYFKFGSIWKSNYNKWKYWKFKMEFNANWKIWENKIKMENKKWKLKNSVSWKCNIWIKLLIAIVFASIYYASFCNNIFQCVHRKFQNWIWNWSAKVTSLSSNDIIWLNSMFLCNKHILTIVFIWDWVKNLWK